MAKGKSPIPGFDKNGNLPPGIYRVSLNHIGDHFTWNKHRKKLFAGLKGAIKNLKLAGVKKVWIDGSFITSKDEPNDIDGCWESNSDIDGIPKRLLSMTCLKFTNENLRPTRCTDRCENGVIPNGDLF